MDDWIKAGKIASKTREYGISLIKENKKIIDILDEIEKFIEKEGGNPAFPPQISINSIAAHYASPIDDEATIKEGDIAKLDIGVEINGCIADTAKTIEVKTKNNQQLIKASEEALREAIKIIKPGTKLKDIGSVIEKTIKKYGFKPVKNLSGHEIKEYNVHGGITIPNYDDGDETELKENQIIAIEPFATTGDGFVKEGKASKIYRILQLKQPRENTAREILKYVSNKFKTLPFTERQLLKKFTKAQIKLGLLQLEKENIIYQYPILPEQSNGLVSQAEHTIIIKETPIITTL